MFANRSRLRKIAITSLTEVTAVRTTNLRHKRKNPLLDIKTFCMQARNILTNLSPSPARVITLHHIKRFTLRVLFA